MHYSFVSFVVSYSVVVSFLVLPTRLDSKHVQMLDAASGYRLATSRACVQSHVTWFHTLQYLLNNTMSLNENLLSIGIVYVTSSAGCAAASRFMLPQLASPCVNIVQSEMSYFDPIVGIVTPPRASDL